MKGEAKMPLKLADLSAVQLMQVIAKHSGRDPRDVKRASESKATLLNKLHMLNISEHYAVSTVRILLGEKPGAPPALETPFDVGAHMHAASDNALATLNGNGNHARVETNGDRPPSKRATFFGSKIKLLVTQNPCREGTGHFDRFKLYRNGDTVREFVNKGGRAGDVRYDIEHDFISIE